MNPRFDVAIVGGGPAGLATAISASRAGLSTVLFERASGPPDKACGEGVMPAGVRALEALGALSRIDPTDLAPFEGILYVQEDGSSARGRLPSGGGLGIRRTALVSALAGCAAESGCEIRWGSPVAAVTAGDRDVSLRTAHGEERALVCVAADGLHSVVRQRAGLDGPTARRHRFGLRQHFAVPPWNAFVEVHLTPGIEAFVTPVGATRVGIAFLWEKSTEVPQASIGSFLARFPALREKLAGSPADSRPRGAGPLAHAARSSVTDRLVLVGDAAGYVDAITGEGLSNALACGHALGSVLSVALEHGATRAVLRPYERFFRRSYRRYAVVCHGVLTLARRPRTRRRAVHFLGAHPRFFERLIRLALA